MEYKLLWNMNSASLSNEVNEHIALGWILYGNPFCSDSTIYQAMNKEKTRDDIDDGWPKRLT